MPTGIVKAFYRSRGFGFIRTETDSRDVFVHRTAFEAIDLKELRKGQKVTFAVSEDQGRLVAKNVRLIDEERADQSSSSLARLQGEGESSPASNRKPIASATLERSLTDAVRKVAPDCEAFVGVIVERIAPETTDGPNWVVKGVRYGKANRLKCVTALDAALEEKQQKYLLVDEEGGN